MDNKKTVTFEEALKSLEEASAQLRSGKLSLEESIKTYEKCTEYYTLCEKILNDAKQKIEIYNPEKDLVEEFDDEKC